jgi:phosphotransferase system HPr-like phosphotransfer protein
MQPALLYLQSLKLDMQPAQLIVETCTAFSTELHSCQLLLVQQAQLYMQPAQLIVQTCTAFKSHLHSL